MARYDPTPMEAVVVTRRGGPWDWDFVVKKSCDIMDPPVPEVGNSPERAAPMRAKT